MGHGSMLLDWEDSRSLRFGRDDNFGADLRSEGSHCVVGVHVLGEAKPLFGEFGFAGDGEFGGLGGGGAVGLGASQGDGVFAGEDGACAFGVDLG